ncbi:MAG: bacterioferritin-associated ferredoxin [Bdellovibrionales bacterium]
MAPPDKSDKKPGPKTKQDRLICFCNAISRSEVEQAIARGCDTLGKIFDATTAGVGACGGSCQPELRKLLIRTVKSSEDDT